MNEKIVTCVIVDDEELATKVLEAHLSQIDGFEVIGIYHSSVEALLSLERDRPDVLFLDIQMPNLTGLDMLRMYKNPPITILTTAHRNYAVEGFQLEVLDYLVKPISLPRFLQTIKRIKKLCLSSEHLDSVSEKLTSNEDYIFIKAERKRVKLNLNDILYVRAIKNHIQIVTHDQKYISLIGISKFVKKINISSLVRIHRSYLVNITKMISYDNSKIYFDSFELPLGRSYLQAVKREIEKQASQ